jgi:hypothetical protein
MDVGWSWRAPLTDVSTHGGRNSEAKRQAARDADPMLYQRMADAKRLTPFAG